MYGNVSEWCEDVYNPTYYRESPAVDPTGPADGEIDLSPGLIEFLGDLCARLRATDAIGIGPPDDALLAAVLVKHFADRQLRANRNAALYLSVDLRDRTGVINARFAKPLDRQLILLTPKDVYQGKLPKAFADHLRTWFAAARASVNGEPIKLTAHEHRVLSYLMHHQGRVVPRTELVEHIYDQDFDRDSNTIEVFVGRLRRKIGSNRILTERGLGYRLIDPKAEKIVE